MEAIIVSSDSDTTELHDLACSIGYHIKNVFIQSNMPQTPYYVGRGKIEDIKKFVDENTIERVIVNDNLRPSQWYNLEKYLGVTVFDRIRLILEIFADRAKKKEGKLQVQLAKLQYERPFVKELFHRIKEGEKPGFLGGGEYIVDDYYEMIKKQTKMIKEELKKIERSRQVQRTERKNAGYYLISIAGYTNAGKSALLNYLTGATVLIEDRMFSTLSTKTSKFRHRSTIPLLFTDTVGFIKNLPHWMIDAFHSTLEEIVLADIVILLIDINDSIEEMKVKASNSMAEIQRLHKGGDVIVVLSKADRVDTINEKQKLNEMQTYLGVTCIPISAVDGKNIDTLMNHIYDTLPLSSKLLIEIPPGGTDGMVRWLSEIASIKKIYQDNMLKIEVFCSERVKNKIIGRCKKSGFMVKKYEN